MTTLLNLYFLVIWNRHLSEVPTSYGAAIPGAPMIVPTGHQKKLLISHNLAKKQPLSSVCKGIYTIMKQGAFIVRVS